MKRVFGTGRYANVTSTMALIVALGGTAYAANTVRSSDIVNGQVKRADIANNAVTSGKVANNSLRLNDFRASDRASLRGPGGAAGAAGATGATGATGAPGATGPRGPSNLRVAELVAPTTALPTCASTTAVTSCTDLLSRTLGAGNWLVQAKLTVDNNGAAAASSSNRCGLTLNGVQVDEARNSLAVNGAVAQNEAVKLMAVVNGAADGAVVALRCTEQAGETLQIEDAKITALQVETVTGP